MKKNTPKADWKTMLNSQSIFYWKGFTISRLQKKDGWQLSHKHCDESLYYETLELAQKDAEYFYESIYLPEVLCSNLFELFVNVCNKSIDIQTLKDRPNTQEEIKKLISLNEKELAVGIFLDLGSKLEKDPDNSVCNTILSYALKHYIKSISVSLFATTVLIDLVDSMTKMEDFLNILQETVGDKCIITTRRTQIN